MPEQLEIGWFCDTFSAEAGVKYAGAAENVH